MTPEQRQHASDLLARIDAHPEQYRMATYYASRDWDSEVLDWAAPPADWPCGTVACLAGHSCLLTGWAPSEPMSAHRELSSLGKDTWRDWYTRFVHRPGGPALDRRPAQDVAAENLGLDSPRALTLFCPYTGEEGDHEAIARDRLATAVRNGNWDHLTPDPCRR